MGERMIETVRNGKGEEIGVVTARDSYYKFVTSGGRIFTAKDYNGIKRAVRKYTDGLGI